MFPENKGYIDYCMEDKEHILMQEETQFGYHDVPMMCVVEGFGNMFKAYEDGITFIKAFDAYHEDSEFSEEAAKHLLGSWLNVVKCCKDDDPEYVDSVIEFLEKTVEWLKEDD